ncbi:MAG: glycosyltransferase [Bdellovibrionales bacterium]|nr:glycosyltransferase [Bdellovibrionales bacterium]
MSESFSIVIPTFNSLPYVEECVASALGQTHGNVEVVVDDNASHDGTPETLESRFGSDGRLRVYKNTEDLNIPNGWNRAISHATGEYLLLLHSDNILHPDFVRLVLEKVQSTQGKVLYTECKYFEGETPAALFGSAPEAITHDHLGRGPGAVAYAFRFQRMIPTSALAIHRSCFERRLPYDVRYRWDPDIEQMAWLAHEFGVVHLRFPLAAIRTHKGQAASWKDPTFSTQYRELLLLEHQRGLTERHHFLLDWASSNQYIAERISEIGGPSTAMVKYLNRWLASELRVLAHFQAQFLRRLKQAVITLLHWARIRTGRSVGRAAART